MVSNVTIWVIEMFQNENWQAEFIVKDLLHKKTGNSTCIEQAIDIFWRLSVFQSVRRLSPEVGVLKKLSLAGLAG